MKHHFKNFDWAQLELRRQQESTKWNGKLGLKLQAQLNGLKLKASSARFEDDEKIYLEFEQNADSDSVYEIAKALGPWKKGPFQFFDISSNSEFFLDSEWQSQLKWNRVKNFLPTDLSGKKVLDIGSNNGFFSFLLSQRNPDCILAIDPVLTTYAQYLFLNQFIKSSNIQFELWGVDDIKYMPASFDLILSMGILYHHRDPIQQLMNMKKSLTKQGQILIETIIYPGEENFSITPESTYANMKNVWHLPTKECLFTWIKRAGFEKFEAISVGWEGVAEQRKTEWSGSWSYADALSPSRENEIPQTIEGYLAPERIAILITKS